MDETIEVVGTGSAWAPANAARVSMTLEVVGDHIGAALRTLDDVSGQVSDALRQAGATDRQITTSGLAVRVSRDHEGRQVPGFTAEHRLSLVVGDLDEVGGLVQAAVKAAGSWVRLDNVQLSLDDDGSLEAKARSRAFDDAQARAADLARLAGVELGQVVRLSEVVGAGSPRPMELSRASMPLEAGEHTVNVALQATFAIKRT